MNAKIIFNEISGLNPSTTTVSSIGTFVSNISQQISDNLRKDVLNHLPKDTLAYKIAMDADHFSEKRLWVIAYELLKNANYCEKLAKEKEEMRADIEYTLARKKAKRAAKKTVKQDKDSIKKFFDENYTADVEHKILGIGKILSKTNETVTVYFRSIGEKTVHKSIVLEKYQNKPYMADSMI
jgi:hypothetical protein